MSDQPRKKPPRNRATARKQVQQLRQDIRDLRKYLRESRAELDQCQQSQHLLAEHCARYREQLRNADDQVERLVNAELATRQSLNEANRRLENAQSLAREVVQRRGIERYRAARAERRATRFVLACIVALVVFSAAVLVLL